ncbi:hypothetical protein K523DRAFT_79777 [Schizophyllum commune Tattone D]|nr:hypothetical protein K523DRAFT_79777 [Schizophyllum commune Tattone D]
MTCVEDRELGRHGVLLTNDGKSQSPRASLPVAVFTCAPAGSLRGDLVDAAGGFWDRCVTGACAGHGASCCCDSSLQGPYLARVVFEMNLLSEASEHISDFYPRSRHNRFMSDVDRPGGLFCAPASTSQLLEALPHQLRAQRVRPWRGTRGTATELPLACMYRVCRPCTR